MGGFQEWANVMGGILDHVGIPGFLSTAKEFADSADSEAQTHRAFVSAWWQDQGRTPCGVVVLYRLATLDEVAMDLGDRNEQGRKSVLGHVLKRMRDRRYRLDNGATVQVLYGGVGHQANLYRLDVVDTGVTDA
jgi:hypothetical protein